jgi:hypothetical protein
VERFRAELGARLREEGFEVIPAGANPDVALSLVYRRSGWLARAVSKDQTLEREVACGIRQADDRLEVVQKATELARTTQFRTADVEPPAPAPPRPAPPAPAPAAPDVSLTATARREDRTPPVHAPQGREISAGLDGLRRGSDLDWLARVGGRTALTPHVGLRLDLGLTYLDREYRLFEEQTLFGLGFRVMASRELSIELAAMGGLLLHEYRLEGGSGWNVALDELAEGVLIAGLEVFRGVRLDLRVAAGWRTRNAQPTNYVPSWASERFPTEAGLSICYFY